MNRDFHADHLNEKWVTDVSEFKYGTGDEGSRRKVYLSAIPDWCDRRPVAYLCSDRNDHALVFDTFDKALDEDPEAKPIFHSDRGYQYTSRECHQGLLNAGMTQSMSRVAHCIDNGPIEGFWGVMKREMYYRRKFESKEDLINAINEYMDYYTNK